MDHNLLSSSRKPLEVLQAVTAMVALGVVLIATSGCGSGTEQQNPVSKQPAQKEGQGQDVARPKSGAELPPDAPKGAAPAPQSVSDGNDEPSASSKPDLAKNGPISPAPRPIVGGPDDKLAVAILEFEDTSPNDEFARLDRALQSMLTTDLSISRDMELVERARLRDVRAELNLVKTGFLDPETAAKVGKGVGAKAVLTGSFWVRDDKMRIDARLVHVESGTVVLAEEITGSANDFTGLEKQLAKKVLDAAGIRLSAIESADLSKKHTSSLVAASRYGRALFAEDAGDLDDARRNATAALDADPDFELAKGLLSQISTLLDRSRQDDFRRKVLSLTRFEDSLNGHAFGHSRFKPDDFPQLLKDEGPERALFYWISYSGAGDFTSTRTSPYDLLFTQPNSLRSNQGLISRLYLDLGGAEPVLFWCDVVTSDPKYSPTTPLTDRMLNPNPLSMPIWGPYPAYFYDRLPDVYDKRFQAQAWIQGDFENALQSLELGHAICQRLVPEAEYRRQLESLKEIISPSRQLAGKRKEARERQQIWKLAHDQIVEYHASLQDSRFSKPLKSQSEPDADEVRQKLVREYADKIMVNFGGRAAQERQAKQLVDRLLEEASGSKFVARQTPVFGDDGKATLIDVMHVAGCPHSYLSMQARIAARLPVPTAVSPSVENGLTTSDDPGDGIKKGWIPCPHCRPLRWAKSDAAEEYLAERLPVVIRDFIDKGSEVANAELTYLLATFHDHPTPKAHDSLQRLCQHVCKLPSGDRKLHATALQGIARITTPDDVSWLIALLEATPWWDVRINAAATLATVESDQIYQALEKAVDREPYYFVKHSMEAAMARARERHIQAQLSHVGSQWEGGDVKAARTALENLLRGIAIDKDLVPPVRRRWESHCHWWLSQMCDEQGDGDGELTHLRRVVEMNPENPEYKNTLGYDLAVHGKSLEEAEQLLREAIALGKEQKMKAGAADSENPFYQDSLGFILFKRGQYAEAKSLVLKQAFVVLGMW